MDQKSFCTRCFNMEVYGDWLTFGASPLEAAGGTADPHGLHFSTQKSGVHVS